MRYHTQRKHGADEDGIFYYEEERDPDNVAVIFPNQGGGLTVSVSEEHAMDSYNQTLECTVALDAKQAERLRDLLNEWFPKA
jgi:hypothetical protein